MSLFAHSFLAASRRRLTLAEEAEDAANAERRRTDLVTQAEIRTIQSFGLTPDDIAFSEIGAAAGEEFDLRELVETAFRCHRIFGFPGFWHLRTIYPRISGTPMLIILRIFGIPTAYLVPPTQYERRQTCCTL